MFDPRTDGEVVWERIIEASGVSARTAETWFRPCRVRRYEPGSKLVLEAPSEFHCEWLQQHFRLALGEGRDAAAPGVRLAMVARESGA